MDFSGREPGTDLFKKIEVTAELLELHAIWLRDSFLILSGRLSETITLLVSYEHLKSYRTLI